MTTTRRVRDHRRRVETNIELRELIAELLTQRWSPQQSSRHLRRQFPDEPTMHGPGPGPARRDLIHHNNFRASTTPGIGLGRVIGHVSLISTPGWMGVCVADWPWRE